MIFNTYLNLHFSLFLAITINARENISFIIMRKIQFIQGSELRSRYIALRQLVIACAHDCVLALFVSLLCTIVNFPLLGKTDSLVI